MVTGTSGPTTTSEQIQRVTPIITNEAGRKREDTVGAHGVRPATKNTPSQVLQTSELKPPHPTPLEDDDDEVSWQNAARFSLEKEQSAKRQKQEFESQVHKQASIFNPNPQSLTPEPLPALQQLKSPLSVPNPEPQFVQEELPADFWSEIEAPTVSSYEDDETFETTTSTPMASREDVRATPNPNAKLPFDMPLFNELQSLFPGKIVRIDVKQKQTQESEEVVAQSDEAVSITESEENE
ncbi:MAG: hypothetical protein ACRCYY_06360 [Trueperaceae bacterium]